jgi:hypothetical protein
MLTRRFFLGGLIAAPAIVRANSLMIIKPTPFEPYLEVIKFIKDDTEIVTARITSKVFGDPENFNTWWDMKTAMHGWGSPHNASVNSIRYVTERKIYEHGDYSWVPIDPRFAQLKERFNTNTNNA